MRKLIPVLALVVLAVSLVVFIGCSSDDDDPTTPPTPCSISMSTPAGGETYYTGDPVNIRWTWEGSASTVDIELVSGNLDTFIAQGAANSGYYPWAIKAYGYGTRHNFQIRVTAAGDAACVDTTSQFTIVSLSGCEISFVYDVKDSIPTQTAGDTYEIKWASTNTSGELLLRLWTTSPWPAHTPQEPVYTIDPKAIDDQSYDWVVSSFNYSDNAVYRFSLTDTHWGTCTAMSVPFRIIDNAVCSIAVGGVDPGRTYNPGEVIDIAVVGTNLPGNVDLVLRAEGGMVGNIASNWDPATGSYAWSVKDYGHSGANSYRIYAVSVDDEYCNAVSEMFSISR